MNWKNTSSFYTPWVSNWKETISYRCLLTIPPEKSFMKFGPFTNPFIKISHSITIHARWQFNGHGLGHVKSVHLLWSVGWSSFYVNCRASYVPLIFLFWIANIICRLLFSMFLISFFETIEKSFSPWIREQIVPHLRGVTVYFQPLSSLNLIKCCLSTDIFGISDQDVMYSREDVETADENSLPDREAIQATVSCPAI